MIILFCVPRQEEAGISLAGILKKISRRSSLNALPVNINLLSSVPVQNILSRISKIHASDRLEHLDNN
jgi:hypothetical protein